MDSSSSAAWSRSSLTMRWSKSSWAPSSCSATLRRLSIASAESVPRPVRRSRRTAGAGGGVKIWTEAGRGGGGGGAKEIRTGAGPGWRACWAPLDLDLEDDRAALVEAALQLRVQG